MGFVLDGVYNDKVYDYKEVSTQTVVDLFNLADVLATRGNKASEVCLFQLDKTKCRVIKGQQRIINSLTIPCKFTTNTDKGETISVIYFETKNKKKNKVGAMSTDYLPRKLFFGKKVTPISKGKYNDKIVFLALSPMCGTSPLYKLGTEKSYNLKDLDKEAIDYIENKQREFEVQSIIFAGAEKVVRLRAKGLGILGVDEMQAHEVRATLSKQLDRHIGEGKLDKFITDFNAPYSGIKGQILDCLDRGYIVAEKLDGNIWVYKWGPEVTEMNRNTICKVPRGLAPKEYFMDFMYNNWELHRQVIERAIKRAPTDKIEQAVVEFHKDLTNQEAEESAGPKKPTEMTNKELVMEAIMLGLVSHNPESKTVHWVTSKGIQKDPLFEANAHLWVAKFETELSNDDLAKKLRQKIQGKRINQ